MCAKLRALVTAELEKEALEAAFADKIEFEYAGYAIDRVVMPHKALCERIKDYELLICEYDTITKEVFDAASRLKMIICCRGGVGSVVDLAAAKQKGIIVCNNAGRNAGAVTDMIMGYIIDLTRNITLCNNLIHERTISDSDTSTKPAEYQDTVWGLDNTSPFIRFRGRSINHMSLGIVGFGCAGRELARKAEVFGMEILAYDPYVKLGTVPQYVKMVPMDTLLRTSDIISINCALTPGTRQLFHKDTFGKMKDHAYFINTSRGEIVVEEALVNALKSGKLAGAALDVTEKEPIPDDSVLLSAPNLIITPHIGGSAKDVQICGTNMVMASLRDFLDGKSPVNAVQNQ